MRVLDSVLARDDLAARLEEAFDLERLEMAQANVRRRVEPHTWEAFRLTAIEGQCGADAAAVLQMQVGTVFKAKSKVQRMLREEIERLESEEPVWMTVPSRSELEDFLTDRLPVDGESRVLTHLEGCSACQQVLESLTASPVGDSARSRSAEARTLAADGR